MLTDAWTERVPGRGQPSMDSCRTAARTTSGQFCGPAEQPCIELHEVAGQAGHPRSVETALPGGVTTPSPSAPTDTLATAVARAQCPSSARSGVAATARLTSASNGTRARVIRCMHSRYS